jgi:hypothetical protein
MLTYADTSLRKRKRLREVSAYVSIRQHTSDTHLEREVEVVWEREDIREVTAQHTSAYVSIRQHTSRQHMSAIR